MYKKINYVYYQYDEKIYILDIAKLYIYEYY